MPVSLVPMPPIRLTLGDYQVSILHMGFLSLDGGAMFGVVPRPVWEKAMTPDEIGRVRLSMNCLLIEFEDQKILMDAGIGTKFSEKYIAMYGIQGQNSVQAVLETVGVQSSEITHVLFSHLHFDHAGGASTCACGQKDTPLPAFEKAQFLVHQGEWQSAIHPHERGRASYLPENLQPLKDSGRLQLLKNATTELFPGIQLRVTGGHTQYHQILTLESPDREEGLVYWGDLIPTRHHVRIPFVMGYDEYPLASMEAKKALLAEAVDKNWWHVFEHDAEMPVAKLFKTEKPNQYNYKNEIYWPSGLELLTP